MNEESAVTGEGYLPPTVTEFGRLADAKFGGGPAADGDEGPS